MNLNKITAYFHDCYQTDLRSANLLNFFGSKVNHQFLLDSFELLAGKMDDFPVDSEWGETVYGHMMAYSKVQTLYCGALFLKGRVKILGKTHQVAAPIYLYPAEIIFQKEVYFINVNRDKPIINPSILTILNQGTKSESALDYDTLTEAMPRGVLDFSSLLSIETFFESNCPHLKIDQLTSQESTLTIETLKKPIKKENEYQLVAAIGLGVVEKSKGSRGILTDLKLMSLQQSFSGPVKQLFGLESAGNNLKTATSNMSPVTLSKSQLRTFEAAFDYPLSLVIGPPGTGKSFTIAALAVEFMSKGKSVLFASKNDQAVNVIAEKIALDFELPDIVSNTANRAFKSQFVKKLRGLVHGMKREHFAQDLLDVLQEIGRKKQLITELEKEAKGQLETEVVRGQLIYDVETGAYNSKPFVRKMLKAFRMDNLDVAKKYFPIEHLEKELETDTPLWNTLIEIERLGRELKKDTRKLIQLKYNEHIHRALSRSRKNLKTFLSAIVQGNWSTKEENFNQVNFDDLLHVFPIWAVNSNEILDILPLEPELFDLVIIDEATQCDIASVLPLLQRGKQAVIVGDPKQLRHLSFLSTKLMRNFITEYELGGIDYQFLNYRENSILDLAMHAIDNQEQIQFLNEHYRSMPDIIDFSNQKFYDNLLTVMRSTPGNQQVKSVFHVPVNGTRHKSGYNAEESEAILQQIRRIVDWESHLEPQVCQSIGILSPFREQVNYLLKAVTTEFSAQQISRHRILVGTAFSFQGEERDIMYLSFVLDDKSHASAYRFLSREDVFNVSITRARHHQKVFTSFSKGSFSFKSLVFEYVDMIQTAPSSAVVKRSTEDDKFLVEVKEELNALNVKQILDDYPIADISIDLVLVNQNNQTLGIDLVSYPGKFKGVLSPEKLEVLSRVGIEVFFLPYSWWRFKRAEALEALKEFVKGNSQ